MEEKESGSLRVAVEACLGDGKQVAANSAASADADAEEGGAGAGSVLASSAAREVEELGKEWASMNELIACQIAEFHVRVAHSRRSIRTEHLFCALDCSSRLV